MKQITSKELIKEFDRRDLFGLCNAWLNAKVFAEGVRAEVTKIRNNILRELPVYAWKAPEDKKGYRAGGWDGRRILEDKETYLALTPGANHETDTALNDYYEACDKAERAAGLKPDDMPFEHCPASVAEYNLVKVEWEILRITGEIMEVDALSLYGENREKYLSLTINALINHPNFKAENYFEGGVKS